MDRRRLLWMISRTTFFWLIFLQLWQNPSSWQRILWTGASATNPDIEGPTYLADLLACWLGGHVSPMLPHPFVRRPFWWLLRWVGVSNTVWLSPTLLWPIGSLTILSHFRWREEDLWSLVLVLRWLRMYFSRAHNKYVPQIHFDSYFHYDGNLFIGIYWWPFLPFLIYGQVTLQPYRFVEDPAQKIIY